MRTETYCPRCGAVMQDRELEGRVREVCTACDYIFYRNPVPAVGVIVEMDDGIVLVRRKFDPRANHWSLPAGYMELGESTEDAAIRECYEETSLVVQLDSLVGVYSFGTGLYSGLVIIYAARPVGGHLQANDDAADARVFDPERLPSPLAFSLHVQAISDWQQRGHDRRSYLLQQPLTGDTSNVMVRQARLGDIHHILALLPQATEMVPANDQIVITTALLRQRVNDPDNPVLVAEVNNRLIGFAAVNFRRALTGPRAVIEDLVVDAAFRRRGVGQTLVEAAVRLAQARSCSVLHLDASQAATEELASFYRACGMAEGNVATLQIG
ncbi:MAG: GNAT family N-acetyltransferase [Chloroflexaceae bacterium]|nr:GNAT family N-acetyltransferase [Chloroflexaceae bacterium]NJO06041.1 GNAT family N-acetyltransferase [Chloroflexaceae bacterium]